MNAPKSSRSVPVPPGPVAPGPVALGATAKASASRCPVPQAPKDDRMAKQFRINKDAQLKQCSPLNRKIVNS